MITPYPMYQGYPQYPVQMPTQNNAYPTQMNVAPTQQNVNATLEHHRFRMAALSLYPMKRMY